MWLNYLIFALTFNTNIPTIIHPNIYKINTAMSENNIIKNNNNNNNIILYSHSTTHQQILKWISYVANVDDDIPGFVCSNLANNLIYTKQHTGKNDLYIAYKPILYDEPIYIACLKINSPHRTLIVRQISTNPSINTSLISLFKRELITIAKKSGVTLNFKPLSRLADKRHYYNFIYFR